MAEMGQENVGDFESDGVEKTKKKKSDTAVTVKPSAVDEAWYLPGEVVVEILVRLPVFAVLKCTAVCKEWNSLISTSEFVRRHRSVTLSSAAAAAKPSLIWRHCSPPSDDFTLHPDADDFGNFPTIPSPFVTRNPRTEFHVFGSVHGLICLCDYTWPWLDWAIFIWNPMVSRYLELPSPARLSKRNVAIALGFGHDSRGDDYKMVRVAFFEKAGAWLAEVYSLKQRRWREVVDPSGLLQSCSTHPLDNPAQCFVQGAVHWVVQESEPVEDDGTDRDHSFILAFNVSDESFSRMELPEQFRATKGIPVSLKETKVWGSLTLLYHSPEYWEVWVKKEYNVDSSWAKYLRVGLADVPLDSRGWMVGLWQDKVILGARPSMPVAGQDPEGRPWEKMRLLPSDCPDKEILFADLGVQDLFNSYAADYQESLVLREPGMGSASYGNSQIETGIRSMNLRYEGPRPEWWDELF